MSSGLREIYSPSVKRRLTSVRISSLESTIHCLQPIASMIDRRLKGGCKHSLAFFLRINGSIVRKSSVNKIEQFLLSCKTLKG